MFPFPPVLVCKDGATAENKRLTQKRQQGPTVAAQANKQ